MLWTLKAERYLRRERKSKVSNHSQHRLQIKKSQQKEYSLKGYLQLKVKRKLKRDAVLTLMLNSKKIPKRLLSLRYLKSHSRLLSKSGKAKLLKITCSLKVKNSKINLLSLPMMTRISKWARSQIINRSNIQPRSLQKNTIALFKRCLRD